MGFMIVWNTSSLRAIHLSRMKIPDNMNFHSMSDNDYCNIIPEDLSFEQVP